RMASADQTGKPTQTYAYDHAGRRVGKTVAGTGGYTAQFLYDRDDILGDYPSGLGAPTSLFTPRPGVGGPPMVLHGGGASYFHANGLGSIVLQTGRTQNSVVPQDTLQRYDEWGAVNVQFANGAISTFTFTGRELDETGLMYYRARYYNPAWRRFMQRDP